MKTYKPSSKHQGKKPHTHTRATSLKEQLEFYFRIMPQNIGCRFCFLWADGDLYYFGNTVIMFVLFHLNWGGMTFRHVCMVKIIKYTIFQHGIPSKYKPVFYFKERVDRRSADIYIKYTKSHDNFKIDTSITCAQENNMSVC